MECTGSLEPWLLTDGISTKISSTRSNVMQSSGEFRCLVSSLKHHPCQYFVCANSKGPEETKPKGYKTFFILNSAEPEIDHAHKLAFIFSISIYIHKLLL